MLTVCPSCGTSVLESSADTWHPFTPPEISSEVERLESVITALQLRRATLLRQLNQTQPTISVLPPETLAVIFEKVCPARDFEMKYGFQSSSQTIARVTSQNESRSQFVLGAVSSHWRQVVTSTPHLWTTLDIHLTPESIGACSQFITNSASLPISLGFHSPKPCDLGPLYPSLLGQTSTRIQELHIDPLSSGWVSQISQMSNLRRLSVVNGHAASPLVVDSPCTFFYLSAAQCRPQLRWSSLTVIHLYEVAVDVGLDLLVRCTNLIEFRFQSASDPELELEDFRIPQQYFILPHLTVFEWSIYMECEVDKSMLRFNTMPALRSLIWREQKFQSFQREDPRPEFLQRLPSSLACLDIDGSQWDAGLTGDFFDHLRDDSGIEHLRFAGCPEPFLSKAFQKLTPVEVPDEDKELEERRIKFPKLQSLTIIGYFVIPGAPCLKLALTMLEARFLHNRATNIPDHHTRRFLLEFKGPFPPLWDDEDQDKVKDLATEGVEVVSSV